MKGEETVAGTAKRYEAPPNQEARSKKEVLDGVAVVFGGDPGESSMNREKLQELRAKTTFFVASANVLKAGKLFVP